jgi:hypothetical protein
MTREYITTLQFGEEMDRLIAVKVMGLELEEGRGIYEKSAFLEKFSPELWAKPNLVVKDEKSLMGQREIPKYSTDIKEAMALSQRFDYFYLFWDKGLFNGQWECKLTAKDEDRKYYAQGRTAEEAICRAALLTTV